MDPTHTRPHLADNPHCEVFNGQNSQETAAPVAAVKLASRPVITYGPSFVGVAENDTFAVGVQVTMIIVYLTHVDDDD